MKLYTFFRSSAAFRMRIALNCKGLAYEAQARAMMESLEETHPQPPLLPATPEDRAYVRAIAQIIACEIHPLNNLRTLRYVKKSYDLDDEGVNVWYRHWIAEGLHGLEVFLASSKKTGKYCY